MTKWTLYSDKHTGSTGKYTEKLVKELKNNLNATREESKPVYFYGDKEEYGQKTRLSFVDIAVLNNATNRIEVICEIEESSGSPKKMIGDVVTPLYSDRMKVEGDSEPKFLEYDEENRHLIVGLKYKTSATRERAEELEDKIKEREDLGKWKLKIISRIGMNDLISEVKNEISSRLNKEPFTKLARIHYGL